MWASALRMLSDDFTVSSESLFGATSSDRSLLGGEHHTSIPSIPRLLETDRWRQTAGDRLLETS